MTDWGRRVGAGLIATIVVSIVMTAWPAIDTIPPFNIAERLQALIGGPAAAGWMAHIAIGSIGWVLLFSGCYRRLPGPNALVKGPVFGLILGGATAFLFMPMVGFGFGGVALGWPFLGSAIFINLTYGIALGIGYVIWVR